jgi:hypothetical protein
LDAKEYHIRGMRAHESLQFERRGISIHIPEHSNASDFLKLTLKSCTKFPIRTDDHSTKHYAQSLH